MIEQPPPSGTLYYVSQQNGVAGNDGFSPETPFNSVDEALGVLQPGDTLYIMDELSNPSYDPTYIFNEVSDAHLWHAENTIKINNLHGEPDKYITITSYDENTVIRGDGANVLRVVSSSYLRIVGLHIYGEVERIPIETAKAVQFVYRDENDDIQYRVDPTLSDEEIADLTLPIIGTIPRVSYTDTRGLYMTDCHHVYIEDNVIHHVPGTGLRVASSEYILIAGNEIHDCSRKSYSGTHALVVTKTTDVLPTEVGFYGYRVAVIGNNVHHNYNEIYSWVGTKDFIHTRIDEGKGISLQRNQDFINGGRILVSNNIAYWNGFSGIHSNDGDNIDFFGNTAYMNSYTNTVTYANGEQMGNNIGISMSGGANCKIANNIAFIDTSWGGFPISISSDMAGKIEFSSNLVYGEGDQALSLDADVPLPALQGDPIFTDPLAFAFTVQSGSPAINSADSTYTVVPFDYFGVNRSVTPTIGAAEHVEQGGDSCNDGCSCFTGGSDCRNNGCMWKKGICS